MSIEISAPQPERPASGMQQVTEAAIAAGTRARAEEFLKRGETGTDRLACETCNTPHLCGPVVASLVERSDDGVIPAQDIKTLAGHGITVNRTNDACPAKLVAATTGRAQGSDFWVPTDDPLCRAELGIQIAEALRLATEALASRLDNNLRI